MPVSRNGWGYFSLTSDFVSHISSFIYEFLHNTLTSGILLFLNIFSPQSMILTGLVLNVKSSLTSMGTEGNTCEGSTYAFYNSDTWNTL